LIRQEERGERIEKGRREGGREGEGKERLPLFFGKLF
jgi:hypothetical protein